MPRTPDRPAGRTCLPPPPRAAPCPCPSHNSFTYICTCVCIIKGISHPPLSAQQFLDMCAGGRLIERRMNEGTEGMQGWMERWMRRGLHTYIRVLSFLIDKFKDFRNERICASWMCGLDPAYVCTIYVCKTVVVCVGT